MKCLRCGETIDLSKATCGACGAALDADGDGVPDALDRMIEQKARALIEAEKRETKAGEELRAAQARAKEVEAERESDVARLASLRRSLDHTLESKRPIWHLSTGGLVVLGLIALVIGAAIMPACVEPMSDRSLIAARLFCPSVCPTCRGPGRIFTWHETSSSYEGNVSTQLCHNAVVDIDRLPWSEVSSHEEDTFAPYTLTLWTSVLVNPPLLFVLLLLVGPFVLAWIERRSLASQQTTFEDAIERLELKLGADAKPPSSGYR